jgi:[ribosomal protein S5]-alanine N-acetyltransferase
VEHAAASFKEWLGPVRCTFTGMFECNIYKQFRCAAPKFSIGEIAALKIINKMIETARLVIKPLTYEQLVKYTKCDNSLEEELNLNETSRTISPELKEAFEQTILPNVADKTKNYLYSTLWTGISKVENKMIGDLCIVGEPNADGEIEIGYGTYDEFQGKGFMTEIVGGMIEWIKTQPIVKSIVASTDKTNLASFKVLEKNNFIKIGETETLFNWRLEM